VVLFFWTRLFVFRICFYLWDIYGYEKFTHHLYKNAALETDLIARLEFFDMKEYYIEAKEKKNTRKWQLFYINHLFSHPKKGAGMGGSWQKNSGKISDWKTHSRSIDFQLISRENARAY